MDLSYLAAALPASKQELVWWSCFSLLTVVVFKILLRSDAEDAIEFSVPVPEACRPGWEGKQLNEPSIKVQHIPWLGKLNADLNDLGLGKHCGTMLLPSYR